MKFLFVIQARTGSKRIPNKVLKKISDKPLLQIVIDRIKLRNPTVPMMVCTSDLTTDNPISELCSDIEIECFRGSHLNVASRFYEICRSNNFDAFVRICADSPMIDGALVKSMINHWNPELDLLTNKSPRTYPKGQSIEFVNRDTFLKSYQFFEGDDDFEHVTYYFHRNLDHFRYENIRNTEDHSKISLAIDEPKDLVRFESFVKQYGPHWVELTFDKILEIYPYERDD